MTEQLSLSFNLDSVENEGSGAVRKREKPRDGISCYRILSPFGTNHNGVPFHRYTVHWGFIGFNGKERSVACSYPTEGYCPVCARVRETEDELKRAEGNGDHAKAEELKEYISDFKPRKFWLYNALTSDGRVIMLEIGKMAHDGLLKKISEAARRKIGAFDALSLDTGVWFEITRTGKGLMTEYSVDYKKISVTLDDGTVADKPDRTPIAADLLAQIKQAVASGETGLLHDIHTQHDPMSSAQLKDLMNGGVVPTRRAQMSIGMAVSAGATSSPAAPVVGASMSNIQAEVERLKALQGGAQTA